MAFSNSIYKQGAVLVRVSQGTEVKTVTECIIVFGPSENSGNKSINMDYLAPFTSSCIKNLGGFWDQSLTFDKQINAVISSLFFQLRFLSIIIWIV